jgi:hypothetical protein
MNLRPRTIVFFTLLAAFTCLMGFTCLTGASSRSAASSGGSHRVRAGRNSVSILSVNPRRSHVTVPLCAAHGAGLQDVSAVTLAVQGPYSTDKMEGLTPGQSDLTSQRVTAIYGQAWGEMVSAGYSAPIIWDGQTKMARIPLGFPKADGKVDGYLYVKDVPSFQDFVLDGLCGMESLFTDNRIKIGIPLWQHLLAGEGRSSVLPVVDGHGHRYRLLLECQTSRSSSNWLHLAELRLRRDDPVGGLVVRLSCLSAVKQKLSPVTFSGPIRGDFVLSWDYLLENRTKEKRVNRYSPHGLTGKDG